MQYQFKETPASSQSLSRRKLILGVGVNDANYLTQTNINGKKTICPYYSKWRGMLSRCYSEIELKKYPSYIGCTVCDEWKLFSNFKEWMKSKDWQGNHLDKDILQQGNKVYSAETCVFVSCEVNLLLIDRGGDRGEWPQGVVYHKQKGKFQAQCRVNGKNKYLGLFNTPESAHDEYKRVKYKEISRVAMKLEGRLRDALLAYIIAK
jgi:hypothetical protein